MEGDESQRPNIAILPSGDDTITTDIGGVKHEVDVSESSDVSLLSAPTRAVILHPSALDAAVVKTWVADARKLLRMLTAEDEEAVDEAEYVASDSDDD